MNMNSLLMLFIFVPILVIILLALNLLLAVHRPDSEKVSPYECGFTPVYGQTRNPFHVQFYIVAMLFLVFDREILLLYPVAVSLYQITVYGFGVAMLFFIVLTIGFVYEIGTGALYFSDQLRNPVVNGKSASTSSNLKPGKACPCFFLSKKTTNKPRYALSRLERLQIGLKKGWETDTLPDHLMKLYTNPLIRIFRVLGGLSILALLSHNFVYFPIFVLYAVLGFSFVFTVFMFYTVYHRIKHIIYILKSDKLDINTPLNTDIDILKNTNNKSEKKVSLISKSSSHFFTFILNSSCAFFSLIKKSKKSNTAVNNQKNQFNDQMPKPGGWLMFLVIFIVSIFISHILPYILKFLEPGLYNIIDNIGYTNFLLYAGELWLIMWLLHFLLELLLFYLFTYDIIKLPNNENKRVPKFLMKFLRSQKRDSELHRDKHLNIVRLHLTFISMTCFLLLIINLFIT